MHQVMNHDLFKEKTLSKLSYRQQAVGLLLAIGVCYTPALLGYFFRPGDWYETLNKPALNPPNWVFAPVWTALYLMMAVSSWLVWRQSTQGSTRGALALFGVQLTLNGLWSWLFFGRHSIGGALVDIVLLWGAILAVIFAFKKFSRPAAWLMVPYLLWVSFAVYLNLAYWLLNR